MMVRSFCMVRTFTASRPFSKSLATEVNLRMDVEIWKIVKSPLFFCGIIPLSILFDFRSPHEVLGDPARIQGARGPCPPPPSHKKLLPQIVRRGSRGTKRALPPPLTKSWIRLWRLIVSGTKTLTTLLKQNQIRPVQFYMDSQF